MVWHAYQINPRDFFEDCLRYGKMRFWRAAFPWADINECINNDHFGFTTSNEAIHNFEDVAGYAWNSLDDPPKARVICPKCHQPHFVPWTKWDSEQAWMSEGYGATLRGESLASGLADKHFYFHCPCGTLIDHELLKTQKFRNDMVALRVSDVPMPGTLLDLNGKSI